MPGPEVYLDANASCPILPQAREALLAALDVGPGNASSAHAAGRRLRSALSDARAQVAALLGARPGEVVFTSGATESNSLAIRGALAAADQAAVVTTHAEHSSVANVVESMERAGREVRRAGVDRFGRWDADEVARLARGGAGLACVVLAQPVTGAVEPVAALARALCGTDVALHVDAAQAAGRIAVDVRALGAATLSVSAHKFGGPQGIGALVVREGARWRHPDAQGAQELGRRPGTEAVALAAAFGAAARVARDEATSTAQRMRRVLAPLSDFLDGFPGAERLTPREDCLPNTLLVAFEGCPGDALLAALDARGLRVSTGTACASAARVPAHVLLAAGFPPRDAARAVRVSVSWASTEDEILTLVRALPDVVARVRSAWTTT
jgi:cysteine desulfurase